jgi:hypothetical protein
MLFVLACLLLAVLPADEVAYIARNSVSLHGKANRNVDIEVFVNNEKVAESRTNDYGEWVAYNVPLRANARNDLYAIAVGPDGGRSRTSTRLTIVVDTTVPQFASVELVPGSLKPEESVSIAVRTAQGVAGVSAVMPDNTTLNLTGFENSWQGVWQTPRLISGGEHKILFTAVNRAGTTAQTEREIFVDAAPGLLVASPEDGAVVYEETLAAKGLARNSVQVAVGDAIFPVQQDETFSGFFRLPQPGRNQLTFIASGSGEQVEQKVNVIRMLTFPDIQGHWAKNEVEYLATLGYIQAYPNTGLYAPERNITRAELATLMVRARQLPPAYAPQGQSAMFRDLQSSYWATGYIEAAARHGLVEGYPGNIYKPANLVTRAEAALMFTRYANVPVSVMYTPAYIDVTERHWAASAITALRDSELIPPNWQNQQRFYPDQPITRAEVAAILARVREVRREIETLLGKNPNLAVAAAPSPNSLPQPAASAPPAEAGAVILAVVSPREALPGNDVLLTAATMQKMRQVSAILPDQQELPLVYNAGADLWEGAWRVPADFAQGSAYQVVIKALADNGALLTARSNSFAVISGGSIAQSVSPPPPANQTLGAAPVVYNNDNYVYPAEHVAPAAYVPPVQTPPGAAEQALTRAGAAAILAKYGYLKQAIVNAPPAQDVPLNHPQVRVIKSAIVTGLIPNKQPGRFLPDDKLTYSEAAAILVRAKITAPAAGSGYISAAEFDRLAARR